MKAAVLNAPTGKFDIEEIEIDEPRGREVLVQVKAAGLCHSDLIIAQGNFPVPLPAVLGHELAGIVVQLGPDATEFTVGDHVVGALIQSCGHCPACRDSRTYQCVHPEETIARVGEVGRLMRAGTPINPMFGVSAFAEYTLVHENQLVRIPKEMPFPQAAILGCGTVTGAGAAINTAEIRPGETVVVIGAGGVGLSAIMGARLCGAARIIAVDKNTAKEALAIKCGATDFIEAVGDIVPAVHALVNHGVDHVFDVVGTAATNEGAINMARTGGFVYVIGSIGVGAKVVADIQQDMIMRQITIKGVYMGSSNVKKDIPFYADLYLQGRLNLDDLISEEIDLSEINDAYTRLDDGLPARSVITSFRP